MSSVIRSTASAALVFLGGVVVGSVASGEIAAQDSSQDVPTAYMIGVSSILDPAAFAAYSEAVDPLAREAGNQPLARSLAPRVLEGDWPYEGRGVLLESFSSMEALLEFWASPEYEEVKALREDALAVDFVVALEGVTP